MTPAPPATAIEPRLEDRWASATEPMRRASAATGVVAVASLAIHAVLLATTVLGDRHVPAPPREIAVEIVQEPKAPEIEAPAPKLEAAAKLGAAQPEPTKAERAAVEPPKPVEQPKPEPLKPQLAKFEPPKPAAEDPDVAAKAEKLKALESELESLKAEREALALEKAQAAARAQQQVAADADAPEEKAFGPLPDSFRAVALPATGEGATEAVGYKDLVFSQLAKAKGFGKRKGLPGSAGVNFTIDDTGALVSVAIGHPSGITALDDEAVAIVRKAAPFPPPPKGALRTYSANVTFVADQ